MVIVSILKLQKFILILKNLDMILLFNNLKYNINLKTIISYSPTWNQR